MRRRLSQRGLINANKTVLMLTQRCVYFPGISFYYCQIQIRFFIVLISVKYPSGIKFNSPTITNTC